MTQPSRRKRLWMGGLWRGNQTALGLLGYGSTELLILASMGQSTSFF